MHAYSRFTLKLTATGSDLKKLTELLEEELDDQDWDDYDEDEDPEDCDGVRFAITGKLKYNENREELADYIDTLGGIVTGSISKKTDYLICNDVNSTSSKVMKARELSIPILTELAFIKRFGDIYDFDIDEDIDEDDDPTLREAEFEIEDCYCCVWLEDIEALAAKMAKIAPLASFTLDGVVDTSESAGEYMDFLIEYSNKKLTRSSSCWYLESGEAYFKDCYPDYDEFCKEFWDKEQNRPLYTEEEYEEFCTWEFVFFIGDHYKKLVSEVPLDYKEELDIDSIFSDEDNED